MPLFVLRNAEKIVTSARGSIFHWAKNAVLRECLYLRCCGRGVVFEALRRHVPPWAATFISSVAAIHGTLVHMLPATLMALACCVMYVVTGRLSCSVEVHADFNAFSVVAPMIPVARVLLVPLVTLPAYIAMGAACVMALKHTERLRV